MATSTGSCCVDVKVKAGNALCHCDTTDDICHGVYPGEVRDRVWHGVTTVSVMLQDDIVDMSYHYSYRIRVSPDIKQVIVLTVGGN